MANLQNAINNYFMLVSLANTYYDANVSSYQRDKIKNYNNAFLWILRSLPKGLFGIYFFEYIVIIKFDMKLPELILKHPSMFIKISDNVRNIRTW